MRDHPLRRLSALCVVGGMLVLSAAATAAVSGEPVHVQIVAPATLRAGSHAVIPVEVELVAGGDADTPILLTPEVEGSAIEFVRGRLLRSDATPSGERRLRFEVPVVARSEGTAILRVDVQTYVCHARCTAVTTSASEVLRVAAAN